MHKSYVLFNLYARTESFYASTVTQKPREEQRGNHLWGEKPPIFGKCKKS